MDIFKLVGSIFIDTDEANKSLKKTSESTDTFASKLGDGIKTAGKWAAGITAAAGTAAAALGFKAVNAASDFEDAFAQVTTLLSDQTDLEAYKKSIIDLSNQMGVSTQEISSAVYSAMSAGIDQAEAVEFVANSMKLASGGFTSTTTAVDVLTTALNAYGKESGLTAESVADMLITTQNLGKTTVDELASYMGKAIPTAKAYGVEMEDLSAMYAVLTSNGIATADSTTLINAMLNELGKSGSGVDKILREMSGHIEEGGLSFSQMMERGWDLTDVLSLLDEYAADAGLSMMDLFSSSQAAKGAAVLWDQGEKLNEVVMQMGESAGSTDKAFETMHETFSTKLQTIQQNLTNLGIELGEKLLPIVEKVMDFVVENLPQIIGFAETLFPVMENLFGTLMPPLMDLASEIFPVIAELAAELLPVFSEMMDDLLPVLVDLIKMVAPILLDLVKTALPVILNVMKALLPILKPILQVLEPIFNLVNALLKPFMTMIDIVLPPLTNLLIFLSEVALVPLKTALDNVSRFATSFAEVFSKVWYSIRDAIKTPVNAILGFINGLISGIASGINGVIRALNKLHIDVPSWITTLTGIKTFGFNLAEVQAPQIPLLAKGGELDGGQAIVGEDGPELIQMGTRNRATVTPLNDNNNAFVGLEEKLDRLIELMENGFGVYLNGSAVVGQLAPGINKQLGQMVSKDRRFA